MFTFPDNIISIPLDKWIDSFVEWLTVEGAAVFGTISDVLFNLLLYVERFLLWCPWPVIIGAVMLLAWYRTGWRLAVGVLAGFLFIGISGLWEAALQTISLLLVASIIAICIGIPIGICMSKSNRIESFVKPVLDLMQTLPSFVYLIPALMLFGLGRVPALFATCIFAVPPVIRLTNLGIRQVPMEIVEAARAFGSTGQQILLKVQLPLAMPTIMAGVNQTIMMAMSMVVIASMVGASGLGNIILRAINRIEVGQGFVSGLGIVIIAIIVDRLTATSFRSKREDAS